MSQINPVTCLFYFFEARNGAFDVAIFSGRHYFVHLIKDTDSMYRDIQLRLFKVKTLLNNAFKLVFYSQVNRGVTT